ncbi:hypothetical protein RRG08_015401 [Elysia crispata]|uniref:Uncharacterized protein n=1 Tax=Elysia crispata TaxID=231223 RepID=A0AAE1ATH4_9GAST|nr:hypothetical protein RRG08_015401 [Elysia crispata]
MNKSMAPPSERHGLVSRSPTVSRCTRALSMQALAHLDKLYLSLQYMLLTCAAAVTGQVQDYIEGGLEYGILHSTPAKLSLKLKSTVKEPGRQMAF